MDEINVDDQMGYEAVVTDPPIIIFNASRMLMDACISMYHVFYPYLKKYIPTDLDGKDDEALDPRVLKQVWRLFNEMDVFVRSLDDYRIGGYGHDVINVARATRGLETVRKIKTTVESIRPDVMTFTTERNTKIKADVAKRLPIVLVDIVIGYTGMASPAHMETYWMALHGCLKDTEAHLVNSIDDLNRKHQQRRLVEQQPPRRCPCCPDLRSGPCCTQDVKILSLLCCCCPCVLCYLAVNGTCWD